LGVTHRSRIRFSSWQISKIMLGANRAVASAHVVIRWFTS